MIRKKVAVTTASDGSATAYTPRVSGKVHSIHYVKDDFADGVDITITAEATGEVIWQETNVNATDTIYPRVPTHSTANAAALYAAGGTGVLDKVAVANDRIKIVIAQGGNAKDGVFHILLDQ
jgi:hypothetical protein